METEFVKQWEENKYKLKEYFKATKQDEYKSYEIIVKKIFELCFVNGGWNLDKMTVIDDGYYGGTQIFIIPTDTFQPQIKDYVMTDTFYGSCSGCDTLMSIRNYGHDLPEEGQVNEYMAVALHLVQKLKRLRT